jgi:hypothetical protein
MMQALTCFENCFKVFLLLYFALSPIGPHILYE